ncbi:hypothetical protein F7725_013175, partial [Dissostichus mawsoni]
MLTLIDRQSSTCSLFSYTLCSTDVEGFSVQQFDDSAAASKAWSCVEKLIDDNVRFVLGAVGSLSALVTMAVMINLHNRKQV